MTIDFNPETHTYTVDGKVMPSVSDIIAPLTDFSGISPATLEYAAARGTAVHSACEQLDYGIDLEDIEDLDPETAPYVEAYLAWKRDYNIEVLRSEHRFCSEFFEFCGTIDRIVTIDGDPRPWIIDLKTTATYSYSNALKWYMQLFLYEDGLCDMERKNPGSYRTGILQLKKDGTYRFLDDNELHTTIRKTLPSFSPYGARNSLIDIYDLKKGRDLI